MKHRRERFIQRISIDPEIQRFCLPSFPKYSQHFFRVNSTASLNRERVNSNIDCKTKNLKQLRHAKIKSCSFNFLNQNVPNQNKIERVHSKNKVLDKLDIEKLAQKQMGSQQYLKNPEKSLKQHTNITKVKLLSSKTIPLKTLIKKRFKMITHSFPKKVQENKQTINYLCQKSSSCNPYYQHLSRIFAESQYKNVLKEFFGTFEMSRIDGSANDISKMYLFLQKIGVGSFGNVYKCEQIMTGKIVAIKVISKELINKIGVSRLNNEIKILQMFEDNPLVVQLLEGYNTADFVHLVFEFIDNGDLFSFLENNTNLSDNLRRKIAYQIGQSIQDLHSQNVSHYDIKPDNILIDSLNGIKISDFGISLILTDDNREMSVGGTPMYAAPEVLANLPNKTVQSDIWSFGVLIFWIFFGEVPFKKDIGRIPESNFRNGEIYFPEIKAKSPDLHDLLSRMIRIKSESRLSISQVLEHRFFKNVKNQCPKFHLEEKRKSKLIHSALRLFLVDLAKNIGADKIKLTQERESHLNACFKVLLQSIK